MDDNQSTLTRFQKVTHLSDAESKQILQKNNWNLEDAYRHFFTIDRPEPLELAPVCGLFGSLVAGSLPLQGTRVFAKVVDFIADVNVSQRFINTTDQPIEATLKFRQHKATMCGFEIEANGKIIKGECKEKEEAKNTYEDAIASSNTAYMASTGSDDVFNVKIGNLAPGSQCVVTIKYLMELEFHGEFLVLPFPVLSLPVTPVNNSQSHEYKTQVPDGLHVDATFDMSHSRILSINCYSHLIETSIDKTKASLKGRNLVSGSKFITLIKLEDPHHPTAVLEVTDLKNEAALMVSMFPERLVTMDDVLNEIIFLVDRSGSMSGSRITQAKSALQLFLRALPLGTMFNIWGFGSRFDQMYPNSTKFDEDSLVYATNYVSNLSADLGGTEILPPLQNIFSKPVDPNFPRQIFVLTDGEVGNTNAVLSYVKQNCGRSTRVFSFGIGGASEALVSGIARYGNGRAVYANVDDRVETIVMKQLQDALQPVLKNIEVDWGTLPVSKRPVPYIPPPLFDGDLLVLYGFLESGTDLPKKSEILVKGTTGSQKFTWTIPLSTLQPVTGTTVHRLTAHNIITDLQKTSAETHKHKIIELAKKWELASKFTSFVAVSEEDVAVGKEMKVVEIKEEVETNVPYFSQSYSYSQSSPRSSPHSPDLYSFQSSNLRLARDMSDIGSIPNIDLLLKQSESLARVMSDIDLHLKQCERLEMVTECSMDVCDNSRTFSKRANATSSFGDVFSSIGSAIGEGISSIGSSIGSLFSPPPPKPSMSAMSKASDSYNFSSADDRIIMESDAYDSRDDQYSRRIPSITPSYSGTTTITPKTLDNFILLQKASGSFVLSADFEAHLMRSRTDILKGLPKLLELDIFEKRRESIWVSALAIVHLRKNYPELVQDWTMLADKTIKFLKRELADEKKFEQVMIEAEKFYDTT